MIRSLLPLRRSLAVVSSVAALSLLAGASPVRAQDAPPLPASGAAPASTTTTTTTTTTASSSSSRPSGGSGSASPAQVTDLAQREQVRKQQEVFQAAPILANADKLYKAGEYAKAQQYYLSVLNGITPAPATQALYNQAVLGLMHCNAYLYETARKKGDFSTMEAILTQSLTYAPDDPKLKAELARVQTARRNPEDTSLYASPAVNEDFKKKVDTVQSLLVQAEQCRRTGQYDQAEDKLKTVLSLDPYNQAAQQALKKITAEKMEYAVIAEQQARDQAIEDVTAKWSNPPRKASVAAVAPIAVEPIRRSNAFEISQKLRSIVIPDYTLSEASLQNAVDYLSDRVRSLDPDHTGINFVPQPEALAQAKPVTISLKNVPLGEVLRYLTQLAQVKFKVDQSAIFFVPLSAPTDTLVHRQFNVDPSFFTVSSGPSDSAGAGGGGRRTNAANAAATVSGGSIDVKEQLQQRGVEFSADGANASYLGAAGVLEVVNTPDQMDLIEELVNASTGQTLMVNIEARFVEINQTDLNDLTVNTTFNPLGINGATTAPSFGTDFRGVTGGISQNNLAGLLSQEPRDSNGNLIVYENQLGISGMLDGRMYAALLSALSQKRSADLLSAPSVRVRSAERATIDATRTFFYPTAYDAPQIITTTQQQNTGGNATQLPSPAAAIPAFPSSFDKQEIGVILNAQPTVGGDSRTIDLSLVPEITDFEGFINYGDPITVAAGGDEQPVTLVQNQILQPVFNVRRVTTKVFVKDGFTVVLGGMIREDVQTVDDKVPVLGDLPVVGRFFQSKVRQNTKKNLLVMVTGRIVRPDGERFNTTADVVVGGSTVAAAASVR